MTDITARDARQFVMQDDPQLPTALRWVPENMLEMYVDDQPVTNLHLRDELVRTHTEVKRMEAEISALGHAAETMRNRRSAIYAELAKRAGTERTRA